MPRAKKRRSAWSARTRRGAEPDGRQPDFPEVQAHESDSNPPRAELPGGRRLRRVSARPPWEPWRRRGLPQSGFGSSEEVERGGCTLPRKPDAGYLCALYGLSSTDRRRRLRRVAPARDTLVLALWDWLGFVFSAPSSKGCHPFPQAGHRSAWRVYPRRRGEAARRRSLRAARPRSRSPSARPPGRESSGGGVPR